MKIKSVQELLILYQNEQRDFQGLELEDDPNGFTGINISNCNFSNATIVGCFEGSRMDHINFKKNQFKNLKL